MKKLIQTRLHDSMKLKERGNCFPTVIACIMDLESAEDVIQIQEYYKEVDEDNDWINVLVKWLNERGYEWYGLKDHKHDDSFYLATGKTERGTVHVCIYQNGKLFHDPHPSGKGLISILNFEVIEKT
jgi:hypothetical protein